MEINRDNILLDYNYWNERGWMTANYYNNAPVNFFKNLVASLVGLMVRRIVIGGKLKPVS